MNKKHKAFTLIEIIIALFIFAIIALITAQVLHRSINVKEQLEKQQKQIDNNTQAIILIKRALSHAVDYIDFDDDTFSAMIGYKQKVIFNQLAQVILNNKLIPTLEPVKIYYEHNSIIETINIHDEMKEKVLLNNVTDFSINYQDCNGHNFETWDITLEDSEKHDRQLPCVVNITFKINNKHINIVTSITGDNIE